jgi:hypothetical protein
MQKNWTLASLVRKGTQRNPFKAADVKDLKIDEIKLTQ